MLKLGQRYNYVMNYIDNCPQVFEDLEPRTDELARARQENNKKNNSRPPIFDMFHLFNTVKQLPPGELALILSS